MMKLKSNRALGMPTTIRSRTFCFPFCYSNTWRFFFCPVALRSNVGHDLLMLDVSRSHTMTSHLWTSEQLVAERYLPDNTQYSTQTYVRLTGFEHTISAGERPQTYILDRAGNGTGKD